MRLNILHTARVGVVRHISRSTIVRTITDNASPLKPHLTPFSCKYPGEIVVGGSLQG